MSIEQQFIQALSQAQGAEEDPKLLPVHLSRATAMTLGADGAGLSVHGDADKRTPLGASSDDAETAERLQFTAGAGPCLDAARSGWPVFGAETVLRDRWPAYHDLLVTQTPFRTVIALPLLGPLRGMGALDLYLDDPDGLNRIDAQEAMTAASVISELLAHTAAWSSWTEDGPAWMASRPAEERSQVWLAMGITSQALQVSTVDALALLRSVAYATGRVVDDVAEDIASGRLDPQQFREDA